MGRYKNKPVKVFLGESESDGEFIIDDRSLHFFEEQEDEDEDPVINYDDLDLDSKTIQLSHSDHTYYHELCDQHKENPEFKKWAKYMLKKNTENGSCDYIFDFTALAYTIVGVKPPSYEERDDTNVLSLTKKHVVELRKFLEFPTTLVMPEVKSLKPVTPMKSLNSMKSLKPVTPVKSLKPVTPVKSLKHFEPIKLTNPSEHVLNNEFKKLAKTLNVSVQVLLIGKPEDVHKLKFKFTRRQFTSSPKKTPDPGDSVCVQPCVRVPAGKILNPHTGRFIDANGDLAKKLGV
jgi:hypothetical protein